jgi:hypothetical protein
MEEGDCSLVQPTFAGDRQRCWIFRPSCGTGSKGLGWLRLTLCKRCPLGLLSFFDLSAVKPQRMLILPLCISVREYMQHPGLLLLLLLCLWPTALFHLLQLLPALYEHGRHFRLFF